MKFKHIVFLFSLATLVGGCASGYQSINPDLIRYNEGSTNKGIKFEYDYDILFNKYAKRESRKGVKLIAVKITNNSDKDIVFGKDVKLAYENGEDIYIMKTDRVFKALRQNTATYLFYLLLTPVNLTVTSGRSRTIIPVGLVVGPGITTGNLVASGTANKRFKNNLIENEINYFVIKKGETKAGLVGIDSYSYKSIELKIVNEYIEELEIFQEEKEDVEVEEALEIIEDNTEQNDTSISIDTELETEALDSINLEDTNEEDVEIEESDDNDIKF